MIALTHDSDALIREPFSIDVNPVIKTMKREIVNTRTNFDAPAFIAGIFHFIMQNCLDNTIGNSPIRDEAGRMYGTKIQDWGTAIAIPDGSGVLRSINLDEADSNTDIPLNIVPNIPVFADNFSSDNEVALIATGLTDDLTEPISDETVQHTVCSIPATTESISAQELAEMAKQINVFAYEVDSESANLLSQNGALLGIKPHSLKYKLLKVPPATKGAYEIDEEIDEIGSLSFAGCEKITKITIPESVAYIHNDAFVGCNELNSVFFKGAKTHIEEGAFNGCSSLSSITIAGKATSSLIKAADKHPQIKITKIERGSLDEYIQ
jgi:hypothetical protein